MWDVGEVVKLHITCSTFSGEGREGRCYGGRSLRWQGSIGRQEDGRGTSQDSSTTVVQPSAYTRGKRRRHTKGHKSYTGFKLEVRRSRMSPRSKSSDPTENWNYDETFKFRKNTPPDLSFQTMVVGELIHWEYMTRKIVLPVGPLAMCVTNGVLFRTEGFPDVQIQTNI